MKNRNKVFGLALIAAITFALTACPTEGGGGGNKPVLCTCNPKEHYLPCDCEAAGTAECTCVVIPRGEITEYQSTNKVKIWQTEGVTDAQAIAATTNIAEGYNGMGDSPRNNLKGKVAKIEIVAGSKNFDFEVVDGKIIFRIKFDRTVTQIKNHFLDFIDDDLAGLTLTQG
jgi:molybdopterin-binding protein